MKLFIFIPSPRDIPEVEEALEKLPHDKCYVKYVGYRDHPYLMGQTEFLKNKEYTHFAISPDDMIPTVEGVAQLWKDAKKYPVIMGMCNVDMTDESLLAMTMNMPSKKREGRHFIFHRDEHIPYLRKLFNSPIVQVPWCGTPFAILSREIVEKIQIIGDMRWNSEVSHAESQDIGIAHDLKELEIPFLVDTRVKFKHMRYGAKIQVGYKQPYIKFKGVKTFLRLDSFDPLTHPLYDQYDARQFPEMFIEAGLEPITKAELIERIRIKAQEETSEQ